MGKTYTSITPELARWISQQRIFFVATAPLEADGHVNCSPKGGDTFRVLGPREVAYADFTGSGVETIAHARQNGRIVVMFCAFDGAPKIVRLHGRAEVLYPGTAAYDLIAATMGARVGVRAYLRIDVERISDSCGFGVPFMTYQGDRDALATWANKKGDVGLREYRAEKNAASLDGLPGYGEEGSGKTEPRRFE